MSYGNRSKANRAKHAISVKNERKGFVVLACSKFCYPSKSLAKKAAKLVKASGWEIHKDRGMLMPYYCEKCTAWHIGHSRSRDGKVGNPNTYDRHNYDQYGRDDANR